MFPLGDLTKKEVREIARTHNLPVSDKKIVQNLFYWYQKIR